MRILPVGLKFNFSGVSNAQTRGVLPSLKCDSVNFSGNKNEEAKKVVIMLGAPNSGKGTYAREISKKYEIPQISTGDILRNEVKKGSDLGLEAQSYMNSGALVPDDLIMNIFKKRISEPDCKKGFILDGFPRTVEQAEKLEEILSKEDNLSLRIVNLDVDESILFERSANRYMCEDCSKTHAIKEGYDAETSKCDCGGRLIKRKDDTPDVLGKRLESYKKQTLPLLDYYGEDISNIGVHGKDAPVNETLARVYKELDD